MREQTIVASVLLHDRGRAEAAICKDRFGCPPLHLAFTVSVSKDRSISTDSRNGLRREVCPSVREDHGVPVRFFFTFLLVVERTLALTTRNCFLACWYSLDISLLVRVVLLLIRLLVLVERTHSQLADHALLLVEHTQSQLAAHAYCPPIRV